MHDYQFRLQLMAEGGDGAAAGAAEAAEGQAAAGTGAAQPAVDYDAEFESLIKGDGKYREAYGKRVQQAVMQRTKGMRASIDRLNSFSQAFEVLGARYGLPSDSPELAQRIAADQSLLDEIALKNGRDSAAELELARAREQTMKAQNLIRQMMSDQQYTQWAQQASELQAEYPDFNLDAELQDPRFKDLMVNYGIDMKGAYMALHGDDVVRQSVSKARKQAAETVAAGKNRPRENGMGQQNAAAISVDPMKMSSDEFRKWRQKIEAGERVSFTK